jgi:phosphoribosylanthranilate isomerase
MTVATKICGLATPAAVQAAVDNGAAFLGFVFYEPSPRNVTPAQVATLCAGVPPAIGRVGLFVDADDAAIAAALAMVPLDLLQFHGSESPARVAAVKQKFGRKVMKAIPVAEEADLAAADAYEEVADWLIFDARPPKRADALPGGNGLAFDWQLLGGRSWRLPWMLSGGLAAETLADAVRLSGASVLDVSSGVESAPGRKDPAKIAAFLAAARVLSS